MTRNRQSIVEWRPIGPSLAADGDAILAPPPARRRRGRPEGDFQDAVVKLARSLGWKVVHVPKVQDVTGRHRTAIAYDGAGFVDLFLVHPFTPFRPFRAAIYAELKAKGGRRSAAQDQWAQWIVDAGLTYACWWPLDLDDGTIGRALLGK